MKIKIEDQLKKICETAGFDTDKEKFNQIVAAKEWLGIGLVCPYDNDKTCICEECALDIIKNGQCKTGAFVKKSQ